MFRFEHPEYLYGLLAIPFLIAVFWYAGRKRKEVINKFADSTLQKVIIPTYSRIKNRVKLTLLLTSFVFLIVAASNPQIGTRVQEVKQAGIDVYIVLDVSLSMLAEDIKPNRLERAKFQIANLINKLRGDRIGLIVFSGAAYVQFPLTTDYSAANLFLSAVDVRSVPQPGTAIAKAINLSVKSFDLKSSTKKAIVVITDGEDHEGDINQAIDQAVSNKIIIYTIGLGSPEGVPIPIYDASGKRVGFKKDKNGTVVLTKLDDITLREIAEKANGKHYLGSSNQNELDDIYEELSSIEKTEFGVRKVTDYEDRFYYFLAPAIILLLFEFFMTTKKSTFFASLSMRLNLGQD
ncbi:MAG: VWA domain-containing protein [Bacteroidetes bacterium]|nr:VWA domain-containing protein [Bacteroidota bacterium]MCH8942565.1 VWA domain-containing protein [Bacteroidota bacterium]